MKMFKWSLKTFLFIAFIEHILLTIVFAMVIYTKPAEREEFEKPIEVDIIQLPQMPERLEMTQFQSLQKVTAETPEKIPEFKGRDVINRVLGSVEGDQRFRTRLRSPASELNPDRFTLDLSRSRRAMEGIERGADTTLKVKEILSPDRERIPIPRRSEGGESRISMSPPRGSFTTRISQPSSLSPKVGEPAGLPFEIRGEVIGRELVYMPPIPEAPGREVGEVVLTFWVTPQGDVYKVQRKKTAGDPKLERIAREWVSRLKFAPLEGRVEQKPQWGEITIKFLRK